MPETPKRIELRFFRTLSGNEPVREWLLELPDDDRRLNIAVQDLGADIATVLEYDIPGIRWETIGRVHVNRLRSCTTDPEIPEICWRDLRTLNLTDTRFGRRGG